MKLKTAIAVLLAASLLTLTACRSQGNRTVDSDVSLSDAAASETKQSNEKDKLTFSTKDKDGNDVTMEEYSDAKVIMFNMWEAWCSPCCEELPSLQKLYKKYKSKGFLIVGVYSNEQGLEEVLTENKVKYPIIKQCPSFDRFQTGYVPTTFFTDGEGNVLSEESYVGSRSYKEWESIILSYLNNE